MQVLWQNAVKNAANALWSPVMDPSYRCFTGRAAIYSDWLTVEQAAVRHPQKTSSGALWFLYVHGQHSQHKSAAAAPSQPVTDWQVPVMMSQAELPRHCNSIISSHRSGTKSFCSPRQTWKISPSFNIKNISSFVEEGLLIFQKFEVNWFVIL